MVDGLDANIVDEAAPYYLVVLFHDVVNPLAYCGLVHIVTTAGATAEASRAILGSVDIIDVDMLPRTNTFDGSGYLHSIMLNLPCPTFAGNLIYRVIKHGETRDGLATKLDIDKKSSVAHGALVACGKPLENKGPKLGLDHLVWASLLDQGENEMVHDEDDVADMGEGCRFPLGGLNPKGGGDDIWAKLDIGQSVSVREFGCLWETR